MKAIEERAAEYAQERNKFEAAAVEAIEWLIKEGYFNKEYLV